MGKHHSKICEQIIGTPLSEIGRYDTLFNNKRIEFKETNIHREKKNKKYFEYSISIKDIEYSDYLIFVNNVLEKYFLVKTSVLEDLTLNLICNKVKNKTSICENKVAFVALIASNNAIEFSEKIKEVI